MTPVKDAWSLIVGNKTLTAVVELRLCAYMNTTQELYANEMRGPFER